MGSAHTKEVLRGSSFFSADLFGALTETLTNNCVNSSQYLLKPIKSSSAGGQGSNYRNVPTSFNSSAATTSQATAASPRGYHNNNINFQHHSNSRYNNSYNHSKASTHRVFSTAQDTSGPSANPTHLLLLLLRRRRMENREVTSCCGLGVLE